MSALSSLKETVKSVGFRVFAFCFDCGARLPVKKDRVVLFNLMHGGFEGALTETERELAAYAPLDLVKVDRNDLERGIGPMLRFMTKDAFTMGRAKTIFINNNFFPFGWVHPNKATTVVQVWHGQGAFKKFGLDIPQPEDVRKKEVGANRPLSYVTCSAETIRPIYMSAFGLPASKIITTGNPVSDYFFREENVGEAAVAAKRKAFDAKFPQCKGKYLVLYAPTFRDDPDEDALPGPERAGKPRCSSACIRTTVPGGNSCRPSRRKWTASSTSRTTRTPMSSAFSRTSSSRTTRPSA